MTNDDMATLLAQLEQQFTELASSVGELRRLMADLKDRLETTESVLEYRDDRLEQSMVNAERWARDREWQLQDRVADLDYQIRQANDRARRAARGY